MRNNSCGGGCGSLREAMRRGARESGGFYGVTMLSDGNRARKSSAFRVIRPSLACARAPIMTSATGRRAALPDRLRWTCLFHAATAMERSSSLTPGGRSIPISNRKFRSRASSPRKAGAARSSSIHSAVVRGFRKVDAYPSIAFAPLRCGFCTRVTNVFMSCVIHHVVHHVKGASW